jgi:hypothetical protein
MGGAKWVRNPSGIGLEIQRVIFMEAVDLIEEIPVFVPFWKGGIESLRESSTPALIPAFSPRRGTVRPTLVLAAVSVVVRPWVHGKTSSPLPANLRGERHPDTQGAPGVSVFRRRAATQTLCPPFLSVG